MSNENVVAAVLVCAWGIFLFFTFHHWLESVRTTLEPGLRQLRLNNLRIRWFLGLFLGPIFFVLTY
ncbi:MAG: hypothetical protein OEM52_09810, partial [bacterium]|nr:hypothetical protein [bacterium]